MPRQLCEEVFHRVRQDCRKRDGVSVSDSTRQGLQRGRGGGKGGGGGGDDSHCKGLNCNYRNDNGNRNCLD